MQLSEWDEEFQKNVKAIEILSKKILYTDHKLKSLLIKRKFILFKEQRKAIRIFAKNEDLNYLSPKLSNIQKVIIYWIKEVSHSTQLFFEKSCTHNIYDMWLKLFHSKLSGESDEKLNLMNLATRKISLDEEYGELETKVSKIDKEFISLKNKKEYWELAKINREAMSNFDLDIKEKKLNALIGNTVKSMISNLYEEHSFLLEKKLAIKKHKSISQNLMYYCKKYMDFQPQANLASKSAILAEIQKSLEELELCEKDLDRYDTSLWKAPTHYDLHLQKRP